METVKAYIAGFDIFKPNAKEIGEKYKQYLKDKSYGTCEGLYPLDNECKDPLSIFACNLSLIDKSDLVIANLNDFRGNDMDSGTAFEIGYAFAKGKDVHGYINDKRDLISKINLGKPYDINEFSIENFSLPVNLMIGMSCHDRKLINNNYSGIIPGIIEGTFYDFVDKYFEVINTAVESYKW